MLRINNSTVSVINILQKLLIQLLPQQLAHLAILLEQLLTHRTLLYVPNYSNKYSIVINIPANTLIQLLLQQLDSFSTPFGAALTSRNILYVYNQN